MSATMHCADILEWAETYTGEPFHALLADAPYEMNFMGRDWDSSGLVFQPDTWRAIAKHLLPGAFLFVFAGTINDDLISVAMRQAGLRKHHKAISWSQGEGFPKGQRIDTLVDRRAGAVREKGDRMAAPAGNGKDGTTAMRGVLPSAPYATLPATDMAKRWEPYRYGGQFLKPALEPLLIFQKPYENSDAITSITTHGAGAINIDAGRITTTESTARPQVDVNGGAPFGHGQKMGGSGSTLGRWPANLLLSHSPDCTDEACTEDCPVFRLGEQSGTRTSGFMDGVYAGETRTVYESRKEWRTVSYADTGTAARMFFNADYAYERIEQADGIYYTSKAGKAEREAGLDPIQQAIMSVDALDKSDSGRRNTHSTVKPLSLTRYLASMLLPPVAYAPRRLLCAFAGVGSEVIGALLAGWDEVVGVELLPEHVAIANARIAYWQQRAGDVSHNRPVKAKIASTPANQLDLFTGVDDETR
jgi:site-specific DNA-methyltransferase (adenine-specific)